MAWAITSLAGPAEFPWDSCIRFGRGFNSIHNGGIGQEGEGNDWENMFPTAEVWRRAGSDFSGILDETV